MNSISDFHARAMDLASRADECRRAGDKVKANSLFREAFVLERDVALKAFSDAKEPTRSVLLRSAASLALECDEERQAERLISMALAGNPPVEIAEELRELYANNMLERMGVFTCHELMDDLENSAFERILREPKTTDRIVSTIVDQLPNFKRIIEKLCRSSNPRMLFITSEIPSEEVDRPTDDFSHLFLKGFDTIDISGPMYEILEPYFDRRISSPRLLTIENVKDADVCDWLTECNMLALFLKPVRAMSQGDFEVAGLLVLILAIQVNEIQSRAIRAILQRFGHFCEMSFQIAQNSESIEDPPSATF